MFSFSRYFTVCITYQPPLVVVIIMIIIIMVNRLRVLFS